jgi:UDP-N-acetylglucosamine acyltransferase
MRRLSLTSQVRGELRRAYRLLYRAGLNTSQALDGMRQAGLTSGEVQRLITFVEGAKRGICGGLRPGERDNAEDERPDHDA